MARNFNWPAVSLTSGPIQFVLDGTPTEVSEDTGTPANSVPLPVKIVDPVGLPYSTNYGVVGAQTLRTAAQIGNATGAALFGAGTTTAQVLRTVLASDQAATLAQEATLAAASAKLPATLGQKTMAASMAVVVASDQSAIQVVAASVINTGSFAQITNLVATAQTFTAPANAVGFKIQTPSTNTENCSFSIGSVATITAGILMEPGRSEDFDTGSNISVIATSASQQKVTVIWKIKP